MAVYRKFSGLASGARIRKSNLQLSLVFFVGVLQGLDVSHVVFMSVQTAFGGDTAVLTKWCLHERKGQKHVIAYFS